MTSLFALPPMAVGTSHPEAGETESGRTVALPHLSYKVNTDDLGKSPNAELAERLIGKGFNVRNYDSVVNLACLISVNWRHIEWSAMS